ncbi:molybdopterin cofactor-binding domain-containing protein [Candidatus Poriferisocius sp.]|uniref:molybdopterin cofactor-binding domain-containing protein n=1 Tax=Candidatus Poriferisocius sp. TaxID=3101276 RepID=UPI003B0148AE
MKPIQFERAASIGEALELVGDDGVFLAGGTNLVDHLRLGVRSVGKLVDIGGLGLNEITELPDGSISVGALARNSDMAAHPLVRSRFPFLSQAIAAGASGQLRNMATTAGNLMQGTRCVYFQDLTTPCNKRSPGTGCAAVQGFGKHNAIFETTEHCVAAHPSDLCTALVALDATVVAVSSGAERRIPFADFHRPAGDTPHLDTNLGQGELIVAVEIAPLPFTTRSRYRKVRERASYAFAMVSVAAAIDVADGIVRDVRLGLGMVSHRPFRARVAEEALRGAPATADSFRAAADAELAAARPGRQNSYKIPQLRNTIVAVLSELTEDRPPAATVNAPSAGVSEPARDQVFGGPGGEARARVDGPLKVTGTAPYAYEQPVDNPAYLFPLSATIAKGRVKSFDTTAVESLPGVLMVMTHENAPRLRLRTDPSLWILQSGKVHYWGQFIGAVVAETPAIARHAASLVEVAYEEAAFDAAFSPDHPETFVPRRLPTVGPGKEEIGDVETAVSEAAHVHEAVYTSSAHYHNPIEPHPIIAIWHRPRRLSPRAPRLTLYDSNQGAAPVHIGTLAPMLGLLPNQLEIISPYVGGSFGTKGLPHSHIVLAALAAKKLRGRPVKYALTRQQMFRTVGYRPPSHQSVKLAADEHGKLTAIDHQSWAPTARIRRYIEQTVTPTRSMYATPNRRTVHHAVKLDVGVPMFMRAPGDFTGMFALETAMDELAIAVDEDPIELRIRNEPEVDPETGRPFSTRNLVACLQKGADEFGWGARLSPGSKRDGEWLLGMGVASATYPNHHLIPSRAAIEYRNGRYTVELQGADLGTGAWTVLPQIAADALGVSADIVDADIGHSKRPFAFAAGGSMGTSEWGAAVEAAARRFRSKHGANPNDGARAKATGFAPRGGRKKSRHAFGAHFSQVRVSTVTGEVRVDRMLGVYAAGRIINPLTARSQLIGGTTMGISAALFEEAYLDTRYGHIVNGDLAGYHIAAHADIHSIEAIWIDEFDPWYGTTGAKGIGELGIVGVPAAIGNAIYNAACIRLRDIPFTPDKVLNALEGSRQA